MSIGNGRTMLDPAARALFAGTAGGSQVGQVAQAFEEVFPAAVKRLHELVLESEAANALGAIIYNKLCGLSAKFPAKLVNHLEDTERLLECVERDLTDEGVSRQVVQVAVRCLGCVFHIANVCSSLPSARVGALLVAMHRRIAAHFKADKAICHAGVWCVSMLRLPLASFQPLIPDLAKLCARVLATFVTSSTVQHECLTAIESLLRRAPAAMREVFHLWLLPVFFFIVNPVSPIRSKADSIIRENIPWITADMHGPEMDARAQQFLDANFDRFLELSHQLFDRGEPMLLSRVWGMYVTIFAKHCRTRLNDMLKVVHQCFSSNDSQVLVAALTQWRCLIYAFYHSKQLHRRKFIELIMTPITLLLKTEQQEVAVRLACVRCWATVIYALGEEVGSNIDVIASVPKMLENEPDFAVREVVARVLAALLNRFILADDKVPQFVIPQMIIGTTTLAASDGKGLAATHGPFSSETEYGGDHTEIMCRYIVGLRTTSPTLPLILGIMTQFIKSGLTVHRLSGSLDSSPQGEDSVCEGDLKSYGELCDRVAQALGAVNSAVAATDADTSACKHDRRQLPDAIRQFVSAYFQATAAMQPNPSSVARVPRLMLYRAITRQLRGILSQYCMSDEPHISLTFVTTAWSADDCKVEDDLSASPQPAAVDSICCELRLGVCQGKHQSDDDAALPCSYDLPKPTYLGLVRSLGFKDDVDGSGHLESSFVAAAPGSGPASPHDLGDCTAMLCAISSYLKRWSRGSSPPILLSQVQHFVRALEWAASWIPLFEERVRADLSASVVREFVYLFYCTPPELQQVLCQSSVPESAAWSFGQFWRSSYLVAYESLSCDTFTLSSDHIFTFRRLSACGWGLQNDMDGSVFRYMTMHLLVHCAVRSHPRRLDIGDWTDVLPDRYLLGDAEASVLHVYSACAQMLQGLSGLLDEDPGCRENVRAAIKLCLNASFSIGESDVVRGNAQAVFDMPDDIPRDGAYAGLVDKSCQLIKSAARLLLERLDDASEDSVSIEDICMSAMSQPVAVAVVQQAASENGLRDTPRGKKRKASKRSGKSSKRRKSVTGDSSREESRETTPDSPLPLPRPPHALLVRPPLPPPPVSTPERLRRLVEEFQAVVDSSSLQPTDICHVQAALANMQLKLCEKLSTQL
ncbi:hypothetical protein GGI21_002442 [Coemansia aciculifera]|nr:hypothetical protein GGI21_002442 [Coemansia aciculifera]